MPQSETLARKIAEADRAYSLFSPASGVLVAVSGGADSVALLAALKEFYPELPLFVCHVNHKLRPGEAERDAAFVEQLCRSMEIPFELCEADVGAYAAREGLSTELAARNIRYDCFEKVCRRRGLSFVATAHTASDNAETVLYNLTRGSGLAGLAGIPPKRRLADGILLVRPLIFVTRAEIEEFLERRGQTFVTDSTNLTEDYTRNYFRHRVLPLLKKVNPSFEEGLKNTCHALRDAQIFLEKTANNNMTDDVRLLAQLDEPVLRQALCGLYRQKTGSMTLETVHIASLAALVRASADSARRAELCLPGRMSAVISGGRLSFEPTVREKKTKPDEYAFRLTPGLFVIPGTPFAVRLVDADQALGNTEACEAPDGYELYDSALFDSAALCGELSVRSRRPGDAVQCGGMTKKLKELLIHKKIPAEVRASLPLVCDGETIVFVPRTALCDVHKRASAAPSPLIKLLVYSKAPL